MVRFLGLDLLSYWVHRAQHTPILWRFHALHHSDPDVDWSTSVRHHPAEYLAATSVFWFAVLVLRMPAIIVAAHAIAVFALATETHSNVRWPAQLERLLQPVVVTLDLHLVHHSSDPLDLNRNFGAVLSLWDRLFGTYAPPLLVEPDYGVAELSRAEACKPIPMLLTPWRV